MITFETVIDIKILHNQDSSMDGFMGMVEGNPIIFQVMDICLCRMVAQGGSTT